MSAEIARLPGGVRRGNRKLALGHPAFPLFFLASICGGAGQDSPAELVIAENGRAFLPVIVAQDATPYTKLAASELADYLGRAGGAGFEVLTGCPDRMPERAIWVGMHPELKEIFPTTDWTFSHPEEIQILCDGKNLAIAGRDVWDQAHMSIPAGKNEQERQSSLAPFQASNRDVEDFQSEYGTVNAVYTFLQDRLGVRWLWPGKIAEVVPKRDRIALGRFEFRYHPRVRMRYSLFAPCALFKDAGEPGKPEGDWARRQRLQLDSLYVPTTGPAFMDWHSRFHESHPEYFALQADGTREWHAMPQRAKLCESNPAVWKQWLKDVEEIVAKYPWRNVFNAAANDGYGAGHCLCEKCRAWDNPDAEPRAWTYQGDQPIKGVALSRSRLKSRFAPGKGERRRHFVRRLPPLDRMAICFTSAIPVMAAVRLGFPLRVPVEFRGTAPTCRRSSQIAKRIGAAAVVVTIVLYIIFW